MFWRIIVSSTRRQKIRSSLATGFLNEFVDSRGQLGNQTDNRRGCRHSVDYYRLRHISKAPLPVLKSYALRYSVLPLLLIQ
jgi:hypothetical protein